MSGVASSARTIATTATISNNAKACLIDRVASELQASRADPEAFHRATVPVCEAKPEIADGRFTSSLKMTIAATGAAAHCHHRKRTGSVDVGIAHAAAIDDQRVIEQRPVTVGCRAQLLEELREQLRVIRVDLRNLCDLVRIVAVMRDLVVLLRHAG